MSTLSCRCSACPSLKPGAYCSQPVRAVTPPGARVLLLGAGPSKVEAKTGIPYSGLAGEELRRTYLGVARIDADSVAIGNVTMCWDGSDRAVPDARVAACAGRWLPFLLSAVAPEVVVLMGGGAARTADRRIRLDIDHGIPGRNSLLGGAWEGMVWPMFEPALGMRDSRMMSPLLTDFRHLGEWLRGEWEPPAPAAVKPDYRLVSNGEGGIWHKRIRQVAVDTESHAGAPWSVQWSQKSGEARMALAGDEESIALLRVLIPSAEVILHNAPGDLDVLERLGIRVERWTDTMQGAYNLCALPQGLKALAYRLFGVRMRSYDDIVLPASIRTMERWLEEALAIAHTDLQDHRTRPLKKAPRHSSQAQPVITGHGPSFERAYTEPGALERILRHVLAHTAGADPDQPYDPWEKLAEFRADGLRGKRADSWNWEYVEERIGPPPALGIGNCTLEDAVAYGCEDASMTLRVAGELARLRGDRQWKIDEADKDR